MLASEQMRELLLTVKGISYIARPKHSAVIICREFGQHADQGIERQRWDLEEVALSKMISDRYASRYSMYIHRAT